LRQLDRVLSWIQSEVGKLLQAEYYVGVDLGKKQDYSVIVVLRKDGEVFKVVFLKQFKLGTDYSAVIGYIKVICDKLRRVAQVNVDQTGAEYFVEDLKKVVSVPVEGIMLTVPSKQEVLGHMKKMMQDKRLLIPYDEELIQEINAERFELTKSGQIQFSHPDGTHDDMLWALALACYATREAVPPGTGVVILNS